MSERQQTPGMLIIDGQCPFCRHWASDLKEWLSHPPTVVHSSSITLDEFGLDEADVTRFVWLVTSEAHYAGAAALAAVFRGQPEFRWRLLGHLLDTWPVSVLAELGYRLVSSIRSYLPHPTCEVCHSGSR